MKVSIIMALALSALLINVVRPQSCASVGCHGWSSGCYCDYYCQYFGNCCSDYCTSCPTWIDYSIGFCKKPKACVSSSQAVPNSWCQTYCNFDSNGSCTDVQAGMTSVCQCTDFNMNNISQVCKSLSPSVPDSWCSSYCHITQSGSTKTCTVDAHMSTICACTI